MGTKLDIKFYGEIYKYKDNSLVPDDQWVVFLAKDAALPATLKFYREECVRLGTDERQLGAIDDLIVRVEEWQALHPEKVHAADIGSAEIVGS